jgi:hypothetical protein
MNQPRLQRLDATLALSELASGCAVRCQAEDFGKLSRVAPAEPPAEFRDYKLTDCPAAI